MLEEIDPLLAGELLDGHDSVLHVTFCVAFPTHPRPPSDGAGESHDLDLDLWPPAHVKEQIDQRDQRDQLPFTVTYRNSVDSQKKNH